MTARHDKATVDQAIADVRGLLTLGERGKGFAALRVLADAVEEATKREWEYHELWHAETDRAEAAEAERDELMRQCTELQNTVGNNVVTVDELVREKAEGWRRAEAAEAERDRLREELRRHKEMEAVAGAREFDIAHENFRLARQVADLIEAVRLLPRPDLRSGAPYADGVRKSDLSLIWAVVDEVARSREQQERRP